MPFKKGENGGARGGAQRRSGPPMNWLRDECQKFLRKDKLLEFLVEVASGEPVEKVKLPGGQITQTKISAEIKDRLRAIEMIKDWGFGKAVQPTIDETPEDRRKVVLVYPAKGLNGHVVSTNGNGIRNSN